MAVRELTASVQTRELQALGLRSRLLEAGPTEAEEAVVFVHGGPGSANDWDGLLPEVGEFARAIAFDLPGFGKADKPRNWPGYVSLGWGTFIAGALNKLRIRRAHLVANDLGGEAALTWAVSHPDNFASAVLINTGILFGYRWHLIAKLHRIPVLGYLPAFAGRVGFRPGLKLYEPRLPKEIVDRWRRGYDWGTRRALLRFYNATFTSGAARPAKELAALDRPALVIWGEKNRFVPVKHAEDQRESFPSAEVLVLDRSGHYPHLSDADRVAEAVLPFLKSQLDSTRM
jgi:pimeloyl-ACP methyl ester carboxylesterase